MTELRALLAQVGRTEASVLITGPSGSGKELAARALHAASPRSRGPFVALNCGAIPRELLESELFGHERGAFTGAHQMRVGKFEAAAGGTLFLDEIGDMPLDMQVALLRVIEERRFERIGSAKSQVANVRIVSATHRDPGMAILAGRFREDLYYRLNVFPIQIPALTERREDLTDLIEHFTAPLGARAPMFADDGIARLVAHDWPGNVRELRNFVERAAIRFGGLRVGADAVELSLQRPIVGAVSLARPAHQGVPTLAVARPVAMALPRLAEFPEIDPARLLARGGLDLRAAMGKLERGFIEAALAASGDIVADAARTLGMQRTTLVEKIKRLEVRRGAMEDARLAA